jgi:DNA-directed RNA polymerase subunit RPC12/RpoP
MVLKCEYCQSVSVGEGALKCENCGAPAGERPPTDYRFCPYCKRRLLALGSPACNYCGRHLPKDFIEAREATLRRIEAASDGSATQEEREALENESDDALRRALESLFNLEGKTRRK